jgi:hypothetical protein
VGDKQENENDCLHVLEVAAPTLVGSATSKTCER